MTAAAGAAEHGGGTSHGNSEHGTERKTASLTEWLGALGKARSAWQPAASEAQLPPDECVSEHRLRQFHPRDHTPRASLACADGITAAVRRWARRVLNGTHVFTGHAHMGF